LSSNTTYTVTGYTEFGNNLNYQWRFFFGYSGFTSSYGFSDDIHVEGIYDVTTSPNLADGDFPYAETIQQAVAI